MKTDLPAPEDILEELADKTAAQIDRLAPVAFDRSLEEMTNYHRFLLALSASQTPDGTVFSYAEVAEGVWSVPHTKWIQQYSRLFERAASRLPDDDHFLRSLAYTPRRLLPGANDPKLPLNVVNAILNLGTIMVHRLEGWVTKRTTTDTPEDEAAEPRLALAGSDAKAYANVLPIIVSAWEDLISFRQLTLELGELQGKNESERWSSYRASWPLVWQHLTNTAYCLALAVWNKDEIATTRYREALVRWTADWNCRFHQEFELRHRLMLYPSLFDLDWTQARECVSLLSYDFMPPLSPDQLFASAMRGAHEDVLHLTAALLLFWTIAKKQMSNIGARTAGSLLRREGGDELNHQSTPQGLAFRSLFMGFARLRAAGDPFADGSYAAKLDGLIERLDDMTEGPVVPGRAYTPSTLHSREELLLSMVAILLAATPKDGDDGLGVRINALAKEEEVLPEGDKSLRDILRALKSWRSGLEQEQLPPQLVRCVKLLVPDRDIDDAAEDLLEIIKSTEGEIEAKRLQRLKDRPVDPAKLERIRSSIQAALLREPIAVPFFIGGEIKRDRTEDDAVTRDLKIDWIDKAQLTDPPMETPISNLEETIVSRTKEWVRDHACKEFSRRPRVVSSFNLRLDDEEFWKNISRLAEKIDADSVLLLSHSEEECLRRIRSSAPTDRPKLKIEMRQEEISVPSCIAIINGVRVFAGNLPAGEAWLFSSRTLRSVRYVELDHVGRYVGIAPKSGGGTKVTLRISIRRHFEWADSPIFEIREKD